MDEKEKLISAFDNFMDLSNEDNRAFQIDGFWGTGKTYFVKKFLFEEIRNKKYEPVYVSLSGLSTYDDVMTAISKSLFMSTNNLKNISIIYGLSELISGTKLKNNDLGHILNKGLNVCANLLKNKNIVLIFDDFERSKDPIQVSESLIRFEEDNESRLVIVSDEDKINNLHSIKEKFVCKTFTFGYNGEEVGIRIIKDNLDELKFDDNTINNWFIDAGKSMLYCSPIINLRIIFDFLDDFKIVAKKIMSTESNRELKVQLIKTAFVSVYSIEYTIKMGHIEGINEFKNKHFNETARSIDLLQSIVTNENLASFVDKEKNGDFQEFLSKNFHKKSNLYRENAVYSSELFNIVEHGYFNCDYYVNSVKKFMSVTDPLEELMTFNKYTEDEMKQLQLKVNKKYIDRSHNKIEVQKNINAICIIYSLYKKFSELDVLSVSKSVFAKIQEMIIKYVVKDDNLYNNMVIEEKYTDFISHIDRDKVIKKEIDKNKKRLFLIKSNKEADNIINDFSSYQGNESVFEKFHLFKILANDDYLIQFRKNSKSYYNLINNINSYVNDKNKELFYDNQNLIDLEQFRKKLITSVQPYIKDKIVLYNFVQLLEIIDKYINKLKN